MPVAPIDVRCPTCKSAPGTPCYDGTAAKPSHLFHEARIQTAEGGQLVTSPQTMTVTLTEPQYQEVMAALDLRIQTMVEDNYPGSRRAAAVAERAADRIRTAWRRAVDGF